MLIILFQTYICFSQITDSVIITAIDNMGNKDTVMFGFAIAATTGVDTALGEMDIFSEPLNDLDLRLTQRTTATVDSFWLVGCSTTDNVKTFGQNIDLKKDFRPPNGLLNDHFILSIYGVNYPITIKVHEIYTDYWVPYCIYDENSKVVSGFELRSLTDHKGTDTIIYIEDSSQCQYISFRPWVILNASEQLKKENIKLFPNPARDKITIYSQRSRILAVEIYDLTGTCVYRNLNTGSNRIDLETDNLPKGLYVLKIRDERDTISRKIVIQ
jgi:hypothetical protein